MLAVSAETRIGTLWLWSWRCRHIRTHEDWFGLLDDGQPLLSHAHWGLVRARSHQELLQHTLNYRQLENSVVYSRPIVMGPPYPSSPSAPVLVIIFSFHLTMNPSLFADLFELNLSSGSDWKPWSPSRNLFPSACGFPDSFTNEFTFLSVHTFQCSWIQILRWLTAIFFSFGFSSTQPLRPICDCPVETDLLCWVTDSK